MSESLSSQSDAELLKRFSKTRCERAFEELVDRYGRLVMSISSRALQNQHDAEDVFQATFLVLAKNANKIRKRESLPSWLSGVAYRLSMKLALKRHRKDLALNAEPEAARDHFADLEQRFDEQAMDEELQSLPSKYRDVLVRFYFLGQTSRQIAEALGITQGAADGRIKRGRQELRVRLAKRGVALGAFTVMALSAKTASAAVAPSLAKSAVAAAVAKSSVGVVTPAAMKLAGSELMRTSSMISSAVVTTAAVALLAVGAFGLNAGFARSMAATHSMSLIDTRTEELEESPPIVGAVAQESSSQKKGAVPKLKGDVVVKPLDDIGAVVIKGNATDVNTVAGLIKDNAEPGTDIADVYEFKDRDPAKVRVDVLKELPQTQTKVQGKYLAIFGTERHRKQVAKIIRKIEPNVKVNESPVGGPEPATRNVAAVEESPIIVVQDGKPEAGRSLTAYAVQHHPAEDLAYFIGKLLPGPRLAVDRGQNRLLAAATPGGHAEIAKMLSRLDQKKTKFAKQIDGGDVYEFKKTQRLDERVKGLQESYPRGLVHLTGSDKQGRGEVIVIGSDEMRESVRTELERLEKDSFKEEIVCQSARNRRWQHIYRIKGDKDELIKQARKQSPKATFGFHPEGHLIVSGTGAELKLIRELFEKAEPRSLFGRTAMDRRGQADQRPQMQPAPSVQAGERAHDRYALQKMPAADAIAKIQETIPKANLADHGGNVFVMTGPMELRGAVAEAVAKLDPNASRTVHQLRPARQEVPASFVTAKLSQDGKSIAVDMPNGGKPVTQTYTVNVPVNVNGRIVVQQQTKTRSVVPAGPERKMFKPSELVLSTVGGDKPTKAQIEEQLDGKKPVVLLSDGRTLSEFHRQTLRQSMMVITVPRSGAGKKKEREGEPQARSVQPLGLELAPLNPETPRALVDDQVAGGLRVVSVVKGSVADRQQIRPGDILIGLNIWETTSFRDLDYVLRQETTWTDKTRFYVLRAKGGSGYSRMFGLMKLAGLKPGAKL